VWKGRADESNKADGCQAFRQNSRTEAVHNIMCVCTNVFLVRTGFLGQFHKTGRSVPIRQIKTSPLAEHRNLLQHSSYTKNTPTCLNRKLWFAVLI
jgi:hypothetical protein